MNNGTAMKLLVRDVKNNSVKWLKKQNNEYRKQRKKNALTTKSDPITKTLKIEKKVRLQTKRIRDSLLSTKHIFTNVAKKHKQLEELYLMGCEDKYKNNPFFDFYFINYSNWKEHFAELNRSAEIRDTQESQLDFERQEFLKESKMKSDHYKKFLPTLLKFSESSSNNESQNTRSLPIDTFKFTTVQKSSTKILEKLYATFYFENVLCANKLINAFPEISTCDEPKIASLRKKSISEYCEHCDAELIVEEMLGQVTCPGCSIVKQGGEGIGYKQSYIEAQSSNKAPTPYDRRHHLREFIQRLEGAERTEIPEAVIRVILEKCKMMSINPIEQPQMITYTFVRIGLRENGFAEFFENITQIISIVTRKQPVVFHEYQKERIQQIFQEIQEPFKIHKGKRKNFLSYSYVLYKSCELLGYTDFLPYLPLFKAQKNLHSADKIWKSICKDLKFQFIPTQL